jgi:MFS family permease
VQPGVFTGAETTAEGKKTAKGGKIILEPQPDESPNDPLNWPTWRRDMALVSLGFYCMVGGGLGPLLAAGYYNIADQYGVPVENISLTTGLYMMGLGIGSVVASPTAILWGKRPVYLASAVLFIASSVWCAMSPSFTSLVVARVVQGMAISPVECLPSATISEIFFLHERAYRIGIYTLMLLSGKNLVPLISAAIIQSMSWPWVFWYDTPTPMLVLIVGTNIGL